jgi:hypothetical protein
VAEHGTQFKRYIHADPDYRRCLALPRVFLITYRKDEVKDHLQKYAVVPFDNSLIYVYGFIARLAISTASLYYYMEASRNPSETMSEISCANGLGKSSIRAERRLISHTSNNDLWHFSQVIPSRVLGLWF